MLVVVDDVADVVDTDVGGMYVVMDVIKADVSLFWLCLFCYVIPTTHGIHGQ